jgi:hypothetical protein
MAERVVPGTSRWLSVNLGGNPKLRGEQARGGGGPCVQAVSQRNALVNKIRAVQLQLGIEREGVPGEIAAKHGGLEVRDLACQPANTCSDLCRCGAVQIHVGRAIKVQGHDVGLGGEAQACRCGRIVPQLICDFDRVGEMLIH